MTSPSSIGIFAPTRSHRGPGRAYLARHRAQGRKTLNAFAEALANGAPSLSAAAREVGITQQHGSLLFRQIRAELGWQAQ